MGKLRVVLAFFIKYEKYLFCLSVLLVLGEIFATSWLANEDGPAHIYNSVVARELFFHPTSPLSDVFQLNPVWVPNCLGHLILSICTSFFSLEISEKILHALIIAGYCFSFRFLATRINPHQPFFSWLIFPFVYSATFFMGFDNFSLGIVLFLLTTGVWLWVENKSGKIWTSALILFLCTLLYLTHLLFFLLFILVVGVKIVTHLFYKDYKLFFIKAGILFLTILPASILFLKYLQGRTELQNHEYHYSKKSESLKDLLTLRHLDMHDEIQFRYSILFSAVLISCIFVSLFIFFKNRKKQLQEENFRFIFWGSTLLFILALVFFAPKDFGGSGELTVRLIEIFWVLLLLFLAAGKLPQVLIVALAFFSLGISLKMSRIRKHVQIELVANPEKVMRLAKYIKENSTGVYIPLAQNWPLLHVGELAFAEKKTILLSNYETVHDFFPLLWKNEFSFNYTIGGLSSQDLPCSSCYWPAQKNRPEKQIDYVLLCKDFIQDSACYNRLNDSLEKYYTLKKSEVPFFLYEKNAIPN